MSNWFLILWVLLMSLSMMIGIMMPFQGEFIGIIGVAYVVTKLAGLWRERK